jgi:hypothetical protein
MIKEGVFGTWHVMVDHSQHNYSGFRAMKAWCLDNVKLNDPESSHHCRKYAFTYERFPNCTNFVFDREADALMFALKWA